MDGLSAVAGVAGIATAGVQLSKSLYDLYSTVRTSRKEIEDVASNVLLLSMVLEELEEVLCDDGLTFRPQLRESARSIKLRCASIFEDIRRHIGADQDLKGKKFYEKIAWYFKRERVKPLRSSLESLKSTLSILLHVVQLAKSTKGVQEYPGVEPIGNWYIHKKRRGLVCLVIDNRHAVNRLKHFEDLAENLDTPSDSDLIDDEQPLTWAEIFPIAPSHHRRGQSPDRKFVVAFRNHTPQQNPYSRYSQEPDVDSPQVGPSTPNGENLLRLSSPQDDQGHMELSIASDVESISRSPSSPWSQKSTARGRPKKEPATSRLILDVIPHEAADEAFKSAQKMRVFTLLEAMAEETIDTLMRRWTYVDAKRFSEQDGSSISSTEASAPISRGRTSHNSHKEISIDPGEISSGLQNNTRKRPSDLLRYNRPKTELDDNLNEALEDNPKIPYAFPVGSNPNGKKRPDPLLFVPQNVDDDLGVKAKGAAYTPSDQGLRSSKEPSTPAPPYPSGQPDQCLSCNRFSPSPPIPRPDPHQLADVEAREIETSKETSTSMNTAFGLFEKRILEMMNNPSFQQSRVNAQLQQEIEQPEPHQQSTDDHGAEPVILKDCLGRKFLFPIQTCRSWQNMENLIRRSFSHIESLNSKIFRGSYDILSPTGEIVLPEIWGTVIKPGWVVELRLWDYTPAGETNQKEPDVDAIKMASAVQSTAATAKKTNLEISSDVQLPTGKRRASLGKWLGSRKSTPNATLE